MTTRTQSTPAERLRAARKAIGISCAEAGAYMSPPISGQSWGDAERGGYRSLDWWYAAALALDVSPHTIDDRLARIE